MPARNGRIEFKGLGKRMVMSLLATAKQTVSQAHEAIKETLEAKLSIGKLVIYAI